LTGNMAFGLFFILYFQVLSGEATKRLDILG